MSWLCSNRRRSRAVRLDDDSRHRPFQAGQRQLWPRRRRRSAEGLRRAGQARGARRRSDVRFGGEEFVIVMPDTKLSIARWSAKESAPPSPPPRSASTRARAPFPSRCRSASPTATPATRPTLCSSAPTRRSICRKTADATGSRRRREIWGGHEAVPLEQNWLGRVRMPDGGHIRHLGGRLECRRSDEYQMDARRSDHHAIRMAGLSR